MFIIRRVSGQKVFKMSSLEFIKMHGLGNDFVILDARVQPIENKAELSQRLGDRHFGVGCDQIIFLEPAQDNAEYNADVFMRIMNQDGSESGACGNATRCVADIIMTEKNLLSCVIQTKAGFLTCTRADSDLVTVDMGVPKLEWQDIPLAETCDTAYLPLEKTPVAVNMGNPHCVFFVENVEALDIDSLGKPIEHHALFPERTNVEFVQIINRNHVRMRVWERGSGITLACGSGACATAVACIRRGLTERKITVSMDGGGLTLDWRESDNHVYMTGPVAYVFKGVLFDKT